MNAKSLFLKALLVGFAISQAQAVYAVDNCSAIFGDEAKTDSLAANKAFYKSVVADSFAKPFCRRIFDRNHGSLG